MPVVVHAETRRMSQTEFGAVANDVLGYVFDVHNRLGPFFDEPIYQQAVASGLPRCRTEVPVEVTFEEFRKEYFMDLLVNEGAVFEFKAVEKLNRRHRAQLLNYLLLTELPHGKLINVRPERVKHEFVNTSLTRADRIAFEVDDSGWTEHSSDGRRLKEWLLALLSDLGTALEIPLYTEAATHFLGGEDQVMQHVDIFWNRQAIGRQSMRIAVPGVAFQITQISGATERIRFEENLRRLLTYTRLDCFQWINVTLREVTFRSIYPQKK